MKALNWKRRERRPLDLTNGELARLRALKSDDNFTVFLRIIEELAQWSAEAIALVEDEAKLHALRGQLQALRQIHSLIDLAENFHEKAEYERERRAESNGSDSSLWHWYGTSESWRDIVRRRFASD